ncbi:Uncharacterized protein APZ42_026337 [Daphnia magna]|uniref:Uncharacterized protein n=1 Tax=Daphnia magna TaxID=35525 RepID=A0A164SCX4_9CRUS|nr:Uncharacterized protein APZ42_026337 [Daphnia magna]
MNDVLLLDSQSKTHSFTSSPPPPPAKNEFGSIFLFFRVCARGAEMRKTETKNKNDVVRRRYKPRVQQRQREGGEKQSVIAIE